MQSFCPQVTVAHLLIVWPGHLVLSVTEWDGGVRHASWKPGDLELFHNSSDDCHIQHSHRLAHLLCPQLPHFRLSQIHQCPVLSDQGPKSSAGNWRAWKLAFLPPSPLDPKLPLPTSSLDSSILSHLRLLPPAQKQSEGSCIFPQRTSHHLL